MTKLLLGLASLPFIASVAIAGQPVVLSDIQMDKVSAGGAIPFTNTVIPVDQILDVNVSLKTGTSTVTIHLSYPLEPIFLSGPGFSGGPS